MANRPRDLFNLLKAVRHPLATSFYGYAKRYCAAYDNGFGLDTNGASNLEELATIVSGVMLRRTKSEALDLPEKVRSWVPVDVPINACPRRRAAGPRLPRRAPGPLGDDVDDVPRHAQPGPPRARRRQGDGDRRLRHRLRRGRPEGRRVHVVHRRRRHDARALRRHVRHAHRRGHSAGRRDAAVQRFQTDDAVRVFVGNLHAAGVGITLTAGTHVVFNDLDWVPANHWQAEDRVHRIGQTETTFATYLHAAGTPRRLRRRAARAEGGHDRHARGRRPRPRLDRRRRRRHAPSTARPPTASHTDPAVAATPDDGTARGDARPARPVQRRAARPPTPARRSSSSPAPAKPGVVYTVRLTNGVAVCDCPGFTYKGNCKHSRDVLRRGGALACGQPSHPDDRGKE